jgi:hypothetical protein
LPSELTETIFFAPGIILLILADTDRQTQIVLAIAVFIFWLDSVHLSAINILKV